MTAHLKEVKETNDCLRLGIQQLELLAGALTHPSVGSSSRGKGKNSGLEFQRLEFLGDRVLGLVVATHLLERFEEETEGELALRFADLVRAEALTSVAVRLNLAEHVRVSREASSARADVTPSILADTCEAVIGAIYLDGGLPKAKEFVLREWKELVEKQTAPPQDAVTSLQIWTQGRSLGLPVYEVISRAGPAHSPNFEVAVAIDGLERLTANGPSKKMATRAAAEKMLGFLKGKAIAAG